MSRIAMKFAAVAVSMLPLAAPTPRGDTFELGIFQAELVPPTAGYFVPPGVLRDSFSVSPESVIAAARPMTADELRRFVHGDPEATVTSEHALFVYPNVGDCMFRWRGALDCAQQRVIVRVWNGKTWNPYLEPTNATVQLATFVDASSTDSVFVLVQQYNGTRDHDRLLTERIEFARYPGRQSLIDAGLAHADVVVHLDPGRRSSNELPPILDCLKGWMEPESLRVLLADDPRIRSGPALVFLRSAQGERPLELLAVFDATQRKWFGPHGTLEEPTFDSASEDPHDLRFALARRTAAAAEDRESTLTFDRAGNLGIVELAIGRTEPCALFVPSITRSGRDGGDPLFRFEVRRDDDVVILEPEGRFGADSLRRRGLATCAELGFDYGFVLCGTGVVKLVIRPHAIPFDAEVRAVVTPLAGRFERPKDAATETTPYVPVNLE
ncbi:MAG: hypothetical protein IT459_01605 [Planctomycetes bacterium]|nr:hypothetical protein [Planctomycetota bacterium]